MTRINTLRIWKQITRPVGINGWCSTLFTLACVAIIRVQGDISPGHWAEAYFTALYFAKNLLALGFLYCFAALVWALAGKKNRLVPALGIAAASLLTPQTLLLSLMFLPFLVTPRL